MTRMNSAQRARRPGLALPMSVVLCMVATLCGCDDPKTGVRAVLDAAADAAEARDVDRLMVLLAGDYHDAERGDKAGVRRVLQQHFDRAPLVTVAGRNAHIELHGRKAHATYEVVLARGNRRGAKLKDILPESMGAYRFLLDLERHGDVWRITKAEYTPISPIELLR